MSGEAAVSQRVPARDLLPRDVVAALTKRVEWKSAALILHAWSVIFGAIAVVALWPNPLTYVLAVMVIGSRQLGLAILMHDAAHGCFSRDQGRNVALGQWFCAYPIFADTLAYRGYHLAHHAHTQQADDPDLGLSAPFPITRASYRRKFWRDISGRTGFQQRKAQFRAAAGDPSLPIGQRVRRLMSKLGRQLLANAVLLALLTLAGVWWAYPLLWLVPLLTWMMVITRIRNIAEHAVTPEADNAFRNTRTTEANLLERMFIAPYFVNYHLEHHLLFYVPCYNLPKLHALLMHGPRAHEMEVVKGYRAVMRLATARPDTGERADAPARSGGRVSEDQISAGF